MDTNEVVESTSPSTGEVPKTYEPHAVEARWYPVWMERKYFASEAKSSATPFSLVLPPPNVTGVLHMGHAFNHTLQDIMTRYKRMQGCNTCWMPGMDHAGIATQNVVERQLAERGTNRHELGREAFLEEVWKWKEQSGGTILEQQKSLGESCDWDRARFTMDDGLSRAVRKVFVDLHNEGLIYRDKRLVNWDPKLGTAISDLEVQQREIKGSMWNIRYALADDPTQSITVATTRPETMLGDTAVAVHPEDERYTAFVGKEVIVPIVNRKIPVVADDYSDPEKGTGAVKITPAHDFNDFEVGKRHKLEPITIFDETARLNGDAVPENYQNLSREAARKQIITELETLGVLGDITDHVMQVPYGDRSGVVIEPRLTDQWFADAKTLAQPAIKAVKKGKTKFYPKNWEKTYFDWLENIQPWCISRQIWWGHQIPAWHAADGTIFVAMTEADAKMQAKAKFGTDTELTQDPDVLDTWFSSALWPFSTFGWPDNTAALKTFYPTSLLVTGFDIIFFWVARMMMMGLHFMKEVPFEHVYIHALVRDPTGQKMSKSKGNVIDPLMLMEKYGTDAFRFTLTSFAAQGRDIKLGESSVESYRNFCNKIWNAFRFFTMQCDEPINVSEGIESKNLSIDDKWIMHRLEITANEVTKALDNYEFDTVAKSLYRFVWNELCDWYIESSKDRLHNAKPDKKSQDQRLATIQNLWQVFENTLRLLHPVMPFITEELWQRLQDLREDEDVLPEGHTKRSIVIQDWYSGSRRPKDAKAAEDFDLIRDVVSAIRAIRSQHDVSPAKHMVALVHCSDDKVQKMLGKNSHYIRNMARLSRIELRLNSITEKGVGFTLVNDVEVAVPLEGLIDLGAERDRLEKAITKSQNLITSIEGKLGNPQFVERAPAEIIESNTEKMEQAKTEIERLQVAMERLV